MAKPVTPDERAHIVDLLHTGKSARTIATQTGRSVDTISRIAAAEGHRFGQTNVARAHEARRAYGAEARAETAKRFHERANELLELMDGEYLVFNFGGRDNTYEEHTLPTPPVEAKRQLIQAAAQAMKVVLEVDKHDNAGERGVAAVDAWLAAMTGSGE